MNRANDPAFKKTKKTSEYGKQLCEKQKVKAYYGIMERQLRRYYDIASRKEGKTGENLIVGLETRAGQKWCERQQVDVTNNQPVRLQIIDDLRE